MDFGDWISQRQFISHFQANGLKWDNSQNSHREIAQFEFSSNLKFSRKDEVILDLCYFKENLNYRQIQIPQLRGEDFENYFTLRQVCGIFQIWPIRFKMWYKIIDGSPTMCMCDLTYRWHTYKITHVCVVYAFKSKLKRHS